MRVTYDSTVHAGYIFLAQMPPKGPTHSIRTHAPDASPIILDFNEHGSLIGIQIDSPFVIPNGVSVQPGPLPINRRIEDVVE